MTTESKPQSSMLERLDTLWDEIRSIAGTEMVPIQADFYPNTGFLVGNKRVAILFEHYYDFLPLGETSVDKIKERKIRERAGLAAISMVENYRHTFQLRNGKNKSLPSERRYDLVIDKKDPVSVDTGFYMSVYPLRVPEGMYPAVPIPSLIQPVKYYQKLAVSNLYLLEQDRPKLTDKELGDFEGYMSKTKEFILGQEQMGR